MQNKKEPYESIYFVSTKLKTIKEQLGFRYFFLNAAVLSRKILVRLSIGSGLGIGLRGVPKYRYYDILRYFVLRYVIDTLVPNIDI